MKRLGMKTFQHTFDLLPKLMQLKLDFHPIHFMAFRQNTSMIGGVESHWPKWKQGNTNIRQWQRQADEFTSIWLHWIYWVFMIMIFYKTFTGFECRPGASIHSIVLPENGLYQWWSLSVTMLFYGDDCQKIWPWPSWMLIPCFAFVSPSARSETISAWADWG